MVELKEREERLRFLLSKIDSEIEKFKKISGLVDGKRQALSTEITKKGLSEVPLEIRPHSGEEQGLTEEITKHLLELNKMKNYLSSKLELVIKEEELLEELKKKHGDNVELLKTPAGEFEIVYTDSETDDAYNKLKASRKLVSDLKVSMKDIIKENE